MKVLWPFFLMVAYLVLVSVVSILAFRNRSIQKAWVSAALWSLLFALICSPGRFGVGPEGEGTVVLPAPLALAVYLSIVAFGREQLTWSAVLYVARTCLVPFGVFWASSFLLILGAIIGTKKLKSDDQMPNLAIPADRDPRERGSRPLNSNR